MGAGLAAPQVGVLKKAAIVSGRRCVFMKL
jgi:peptide deformylase